MNKRLMTAMCMATVFGLSAAAAAQDGTMAKDQMGKDKMKDGQMTVSGCVAAGKGSGQFMLTNAMTTGGMNTEMDHGKMDKDKMDKDKMMKPGMGGHQMMSYDLIGGTNLKAHMGHKVEVTGTMSKMDMDRMGKMGQMGTTDTMAKDKTTGKDMMAMKLNVTSVKMISATCP